MKKLSSILAVVLLFVAFALSGAAQVNAYVGTAWSCGPYRVWSPDGHSWYHIQSCIREDASGKIYAQASAWHSSGTIYGGPCFVGAVIEDHSNGNFWAKIGPLKGMNCGTSATETIYLNWPDLIRGHVYIAHAVMNKGFGGNSPYTYSHYLEFK